MFEYLAGLVTLVDPAYIVVECAGVGYKVYCPKPFDFKEGQKARVYVEQVVRDTGINLYGFASKKDKVLFLKLLSVSGIGPKSALAIMAAEDTESLASAIEKGEVKYLTRFPGVGKKTASQIVLDLKGKLNTLAKKPVENVSPALNDALLALAALGYSQREVDRISPRLAKLPNLTADQYIKEGLNLLLKK